MAKNYQRITLNFFLDTDNEIDIYQVVKAFAKSSDFQHGNLSVHLDGDYAFITDVYAMDFEDFAHSRAAVKQLFEFILERL